VADQLELVELARASYAQVVGEPLRGKDVLETGAGQVLAVPRVLPLKNRVICLDFVNKAGTRDCTRVWVGANGYKRAAKTLARKSLRLDSSLVHQLERQVGVTRLPMPAVRRLDVRQLDLPDESFDLVYSVNTYSMCRTRPAPGGSRAGYCGPAVAC
jgi:hypothetical protein